MENASNNLPSPIVEVAESVNGSPPRHHQTIFFPPSAPSPYSPPPLTPCLPPEERRGSAPESRRGSQHSMTGYGGLPPSGPHHNPRRGSATGSYGIPVPPEWLRTHSESRRLGPRLHSSSSWLPLQGRDSPTQRIEAKKQHLTPLKSPRLFSAQLVI